METEEGAPAEGRTPLEELFAAVRAGNVVRTEAALAALEARQALEANERNGGREDAAPQSYWGGLWAATGGGARSSSPDGPAFPSTLWLDEARDADGHTALHWAALEGHTGIVRRLLQAGASVDVRSRGADQLGQTPLMWAVVGGHLEVVRLLVEEAGSDAAAVDARGYSPMVHAVQYGYIDIVHWLSQLRRAPDGRTGRAAEPAGGEVAALAPGYEDPEITATTADGASECVWIRDAEEHTLLHWAAYREQLALVQYLMIYHGLDPNACDASGNTPLHRALQRNHFRVTRALLRRGASDTIRNKSGLLPHELAREKGYRWLSAYVLEWSRLGREPPPYSETCIRALTRNKAKEVHASASGGGGGGGGGDQDARTDERDSPGVPPLRARWLLLRRHLPPSLWRLWPRFKARCIYGRYGLRLHGLVYFYYYLIVFSAAMFYRWFAQAHGGVRSLLNTAVSVVIVVNVVASLRTTYGDPGLLERVPESVLLSMLPSADLALQPASTLTTDIGSETFPPERGDQSHCTLLPPATAAADARARRLLNYLFAALTDTRSVNRYFCFSCLNIKPPRAKHCVLLDRCVARYDHYCPWMNNTIGARNHSAFLVWLASLLWLQGTYVYTMMRLVFFTPDYPYSVANVGLAGALRTMPQAFALLVCHLVFPVLVLPLAIQQMYLYYVADLTTNESINYERYTYLSERQMRAAMCGRFAWWTQRGLCGCGAAVWSALSRWCRRSVHAGKYRLLGKRKRADGTGDASV